MADNDKAVEGRAGSGWELLRTRNFGLLFSGQAVSQIGESMNKVALLWFVYALTGSAFKMTVIGLLQTIPPLVFGPLIGVYLDRMKKKPVMIWVDLIRTGLVMLIPLLYTMEALTLEWLYVLVFATSIVSTVFGPALASAVPLLVPRTRLTAANALIQSTTNIGLLIGPAVSGVGIAMIGAHNVLYLNAITFLVSVLCLVPIRLHETLQTCARVAGRATILQDLLVGFRFVFVQQRTVLLLMLTAALYSLGASAFVFLLPVFATQLLDASSVELGWLWSSLGIGMLAASAWLAWINQGDFQNRLRLISAALAVGAVAVCVLGMLEAPVMAAALIVVFGGSTAMFTPIVWAMLQELTPEPLLGRVFTTFSTGAMASAMAGMAAFGWIADTAGPAASLVGIGLLLLGTATLAAAFSRRNSHTTTSGFIPA
ncbi:MAG TPA: MFS transporter [Nitrospiraceae bacterium]|nr:MFS transporter [Nitrospiraceae bacterium]